VEDIGPLVPHVVGLRRFFILLPQTRIFFRSFFLILQQQILMLQVGRGHGRTGKTQADELSVDEKVLYVDVGEEPPLWILLLDVELQAHLFRQDKAFVPPKRLPREEFRTLFLTTERGRCYTQVMNDVAIFQDDRIAIDYFRHKHFLFFRLAGRNEKNKKDKHCCESSIHGGEILHYFVAMINIGLHLSDEAG